MARISRKCYESSYFHVMVQGIEKKNIFGDSELKCKYLEFLKRSVNGRDVKIIAYCIMDNHAHLLFYTQEINNLSKVMASLNTRYAKLYNQRENRCGYVYRDRYRCENIMSQTHLDNCVKYIHYNPVNANICKEPLEYKYSSYCEYKNKKIDREIIELLFWDFNNYSEKLDGSFKDYNYIDVQNEFGEHIYENPEDVIKEFINLDDKKVLYDVICNLQKRCNINNEKIADLLSLSRSSLYRILKEFR